MLTVEAKNNFIDKETSNPMSRITLVIDVEDYQEKLKSLSPTQFNDYFIQNLIFELEWYDNPTSDDDFKITITDFESAEESKLVRNLIKDYSQEQLEQFTKDYPCEHLNEAYSNTPNQEPVFLGSRIGFYTDEDFSKYRALIKQLKQE